MAEEHAIWFTAVVPFGPADGERWTGYLDWRGFQSPPQLATLDTSLCPTLIEDLTRDDWDHNVQEDYVTFWFRHLDYLLARTASSANRQVLAGWRQPPADLGDDGIAAALDDPRFDFQGFELLDVHGDISALTNCTGFEDAFDDSELNGAGLIGTVARAYAVQAALKITYAGHGHEDTHVWAVWRMGGAGKLQ